MGFGLRVKKLVLNTCLPDLQVLTGWPSISLWEVEVVSAYHPGISVETKTEHELLHENSHMWLLTRVLSLYSWNEGKEGGRKRCKMERILHFLDLLLCACCCANFFEIHMSIYLGCYYPRVHK